MNDDYLDISSESKGSASAGDNKKRVRLTGFILGFLGFVVLVVAFFIVWQGNGIPGFAVGAVGVILLLIGVALSGAKVWSRKDRYEED